MSDNEPITILLPIKNGERFLLNAIKSIEANISDIDEVLVIDDGSTDSTSKLLVRWQTENSRVRTLKGSSSGLVNALNLGLNNASNNWVARFDVDDSYSTSRLFEQRKWINDDIALIFSDYEIKSAGGSEMGTIHGAIFHPAVSLSLITSSRTPHPGALFNRLVALEVGGYRSEDFPAEDLSLWLRMSRMSRLVSVPMPLLKYKMHEDSITSNMGREMRKKTIDLLHFFKIYSRDLVTLEHTWEEIYHNYKFFSKTSERRIFFLRDLIALSRLHPELTWVRSAKLGIAVRLLLNPYVVFVIVKMKIEQIRRRVQRKLH